MYMKIRNLYYNVQKIHNFFFSFLQVSQTNIFHDIFNRGTMRSYWMKTWAYKDIQYFTSFDT